MVAALGDDALVTLARQRRVHFEVEQQSLPGSTGRVAVGFEVHLFAVHEKGAKALPGCPKCMRLLQDLRAIAEWLVSREGPGVPREIVPWRSVLYDSREVPGADEVALAVRMTRDPGHDASGGIERQLKEIRARFKLIGVPER